MYKIYESGNYFYVENVATGRIYKGHKKDVLVSRLDSGGVIFTFVGLHGVWNCDNSLAFADIVDVNGVAFPTIQDFITFYEDNTGNFNKGGAASVIGQTNRVVNYFATDYTDLTTNIALTPIDGEIAILRNAQGTAWLPYNLGGTYYPKGGYIFDGVNWIPQTDLITQQLQLNIDDIAAIVSADGPIDTHIDVSTVGKVIGDSLVWNGTNWIPQKPKYYNKISSSDAIAFRPLQTTEGLINQQANIFEQYLTLTINPTKTGIHKINTNFIWSHNVQNDNFRAELVLNDSLGSPAIRFRFLDLESKDAAGVGMVLNRLQGGVIVANQNSFTDARNSTSHSKFFTFTLGVTYFISLEWASQSINDEAAIYSGIIDVQEI